MVALNTIQVWVKMSFHNFLIPDKGLYKTAVGALGKMFAEAAFTTLYLFTTELYPTVLRSVNYLILSSYCAHLQAEFMPRGLFQAVDLLKHLNK